MSERFAWSGPESVIDIGEGSFKAMDNAQKSTGDKVVSEIDSVTQVIGSLVPTIGAIGSMVRLIATAFRPSDAQKAQAFDAAIAEFDTAAAGLAEAVAGFEAAKAAASKAASGSQG